MGKSLMSEALKAHMKLNNVTARGLGRSLDIDHTAISRFVSGKSISLANFSKLLIGFIVEIDNPQDTTSEQTIEKKPCYHCMKMNPVNEWCDCIGGRKAMMIQQQWEEKLKTPAPTPNKDKDK